MRRIPLVNCCSREGCAGFDREFDESTARKELSRLRRKGPSAMTAALIDALSDGAVVGNTVLDIGGGVGAVHLALLERGAANAIDVDASAAYLAVARDEADRRGLAARVQHVEADFTDAARALEPVDIVALDRVVCCYGDPVAMVSAAAALSRQRIGLVYPVDRLWTRALVRLTNLWNRLTGHSFRAFVHPTSVIDRLIRDAGFVPWRTRQGLIWQLAVYART
jgi:magnesium-protoporphyrin O-methyltransferase